MDGYDDQRKPRVVINVQVEYNWPVQQRKVSSKEKDKEAVQV
jgi:hypothetical protein